jgi:1-phosphofructokinase family hexose kinase
VKRAQILCLGPTPALQRVMVFRKLALDEVNRAELTQDSVAGKAVNVAKVLNALGEHPVAIGFLGGERGETLRVVLEQHRIEIDFVETAAPTRQCVTVIDKEAGLQTELVEESSAIKSADYERLLGIVRHRLRTANALVMSGTLTPGGPEHFYARCVRLAQDEGVLSVVDAKGAPLRKALKARPGLVKPNRAELAATVGHVLHDERDTIKAMRDLHAQGAERVVVTAGKEPTLAFDGRNVWRIRPPRIKAVNPIGSGDSFTAGLVWRLLKRDDLGEACRWGSAAGAANALTLMAGEVEPGVANKLARLVKIEKLK